MNARDRILSKLRRAQAPFADLAPIAERRHMIPLGNMSPEQQLERFIAEAQAQGCIVYRLDANSAVEQLLDIIAGDNSVLSWDESDLPLEGLHGILRSLEISIAPPDDGSARVGITGVSASLAATGSLVLEGGAGRHRGPSLLPDVHIALMSAGQLLPDLETWQGLQQRDGYPAFTSTSSTTMVTGPSKTADIGHQLVKGAHGPREVHIVILR